MRTIKHNYTKATTNLTVFFLEPPETQLCQTVHYVPLLTKRKYDIWHYHHNKISTIESKLRTLFIDTSVKWHDEKAIIS